MRVTWKDKDVEQIPTFQEDDGFQVKQLEDMEVSPQTDPGQ